MKKYSALLALVLAAAMLPGLAACGGNTNPPAAPQQNEQNAPQQNEQDTPPQNEQPAAQSEVDKIKQSGKLTVSLEGGFEPFEFYEGNDIVGIDIDIANHIADKLGVSLEIQDMEFNAALTAVSTGVVNIALSGISWTEERSKEMEFSQPYFDSSQLIVVRADSDIKSIDDLKDKKLGAQAGTTGEEMAIEFVGEANVSGYDKYVMAIQDLKNKRIDAIVMDAYPAKSNVKANEGELITLDEPLGVDTYCIAMKKGNTELLAEIDKILDELKESGELDRIIDSYKSMLE